MIVFYVNKNSFTQPSNEGRLWLHSAVGSKNGLSDPLDVSLTLQLRHSSKHGCL